jgi:hypothetical protein
VQEVQEVQDEEKHVLYEGLAYAEVQLPLLLHEIFLLKEFQKEEFAKTITWEQGTG